jgi:tetratricopeptide (TPR) repeat protein
MTRLAARPLGLYAALAIAFAAPCSAQETVADYVKIAEQKAGRQDLDGALAIYDEILKQFPKEFISLYAERASVRERALDFPGAIADYDQVLKLDSPDPAKAQMIRPRILAERGKLKSMVEDYAGAIADYTAALSADPAIAKYKPYDLSSLHKDRAEAREFSGDLKGAVHDYDAALALDANNSFLLSDRAALKRQLRDYNGAIADYSASIAKADKPSSITYQQRGVTRFCKGDLEGALADLEKDASLSLVTDGEVYHSPIVHETNLLIWALRARLQGREKADAELSSYLASAKHSGSPDTNFDIAEYFLDKAPESKLLDNARASAGKADDGGAFKSVALYHIGMKRLVDGDLAGAQANFSAVLKLSESMQYMDELARSELARTAAPKAKAK